MANAIVTVKIMPSSPDVNLEEVEVKVKKIIEDFAGEGDTKTTVSPVAFGLNQMEIIFVMDESLGSPDPVAEKAEEMEEINSAEITDVRRALG